MTSDSKFKEHIRSFYNLLKSPWRLQLLAMEAGITLFYVRALLRFVPFEYGPNQMIQRSVRNERSSITKDVASGDAGRRTRTISMQRVTDIVWAVDRVSRRVPEQLACLPRALAVCQMVKRRGGTVTLEIGIRKGADNQIAAHAWAVYERTVVIGAIPDLEQYSKLDNWPVFKGRAQSGYRNRI